jgi:hypothetical protein
VSPVVRFASSLLLLLVTACAAHAGGELYLRWDNCIGDGGVNNRTFACDTNSGVETLVASFRLDQTFVGMNWIQGYLDIASIDPSSMPAWWQIGYCRPMNTVLGSFNPPATSTTCFDGWAGRAAGGATYAYPTGFQYVGARIDVVAGLPSPASFTVLAGQEVYAFTVEISHTRTAGLGSCSGCTTPVCISFGHAGLASPDTTLPWIVGSATPNNGSNVTWQTGAVATTTGTCPAHGPCNTGVICQSATPASGHTWGSIKSLYR